METCLPLVLPLLESNFERGSALSRVFPRHPLPVPLGISPSAHTYKLCPPWAGNRLYSLSPLYQPPTIPAQQRSSVSQAKTAARSPCQPVTCGSCVSNQVSVASCKSKPISVATGTGTFRYVSWGRPCAGPVGEPVLIQSEMPHTHALMHTITHPDG